MQNPITQFPIHSSDLTRAACLARQIQTLALAGPLECDLEVVEALAEALERSLSAFAGALEVREND